jgi:6-phosphogluconate dehydrogenase
MMADGEIGVIGLGVMGRNLLLNIAEKGFPAAGYDRNPEKVRALAPPLRGAREPKELCDGLRAPRAILLLVPAGDPVDEAIGELLPHLDEGDVIVDGGNSFYRDTDRRAAELLDQGIAYLGMGISGGEEGARLGPSLMPGGSLEAFRRLQPLLEKIAAQAGGEPCVAYLGPGSAGHYVKLVHNGIEYGIMELIAESYDLMKRGLGLDDDALHEVYRAWSEGELSGYLMEITARVFLQPDDLGPGRLIDAIRDSARQKGTGRWTSQDAMDLLVPVPGIDAAVTMRNLMAARDERAAASAALHGPDPRHAGDRDRFLRALADALHAGIVLTFAQGMALLRTASAHNDYGLDLERVAAIWRGGCIIRAALLEPIRAAFARRAELPNLLLDAELGRAVTERQASLRETVRAGVDLGIPLPGFMAALAYFDGYRSARLPGNLIQALRDLFGAHTYERADREGVFHAPWTGR